MTPDEQLTGMFDDRARRRSERREFFRMAAGAAAVGAAAAMMPGIAAAQAAPSDNDILNLALNLEYLEANFYSYAVFGTPIAASMTTGSVGTAGAATGGRKVVFSDPVVAAYAREIAQDEIAHVAFLRSALGSAAIAQPTIDVGIAPTGAFSSAARAAGVISATDPAAFFDPYASDENFLLGAFIFEDVGVTAYKGASPLISNKTYLAAAAGILAVEAYHAGLVRTVLYRKGIGTPASNGNAAIPANPALITYAGQISDARDSLDGSSDDDQGIANVTVAEGSGSNIAPLDPNGLAYSRNSGQVHNIAYLTKNAASSGGFFPNGTNNANASLRVSQQN